MSRGGKREGAGRPPIDPQMVKIPVGYKLPRWLVEWLRKQEMPAAQLIEAALCAAHDLKSPQDQQFSEFELGIVESVIGPAPAPRRVISVLDDYIAASMWGQHPAGKALVEKLKKGGYEAKRQAVKSIGNPCRADAL